jgi:hypothetical protein
MKKSYHLEVNNNDGYLTLTNGRIMFIAVKGFLRKSYKKTLDYRYDEIQNIRKIKSHTIELFTKDGKKHLISTLGIPAIHLVSKLDYYIQYASQELVENVVVTSSQGEKIGK